MGPSSNTHTRRWFQFRLRTLLLVVLVFSIVLAAVTQRWRVWQSQHQAYHQLVASQLASFEFFNQWEERPGVEWMSNYFDPPAPLWQRFCFGEFTGTTRVELSVSVLAALKTEVKRDENGEYVHERDATTYWAAWDDSETLQSILALDRLDMIVLRDGGGATPTDVLREQITPEKLQAIHRKFPNCEVTYAP